MNKNNLKDTFISYCIQKKFEKNQNQIKIIEMLDEFIKPKNFFSELIFKKKKIMFLFTWWCWRGKNNDLQSFI